jgi:hypothetical protein
MKSGDHGLAAIQPLASVSVSSSSFSHRIVLHDFCDLSQRKSLYGPAAASHTKAIFPQLPPCINRSHVPDHRTAKEHLLKIIVGVEAGRYFIN